MDRSRSRCLAPSGRPRKQARLKVRKAGAQTISIDEHVALFADSFGQTNSWRNAGEMNAPGLTGRSIGTLRRGSQELCDEISHGVFDTCVAAGALDVRGIE